MINCYLEDAVRLFRLGLSHGHISVLAYGIIFHQPFPSIFQQLTFRNAVETKGIIVNIFSNYFSVSTSAELAKIRSLARKAAFCLKVAAFLQ